MPCDPANAAACSSLPHQYCGAPDGGAPVCTSCSDTDPGGCGATTCTVCAGGLTSCAGGLCVCTGSGLADSCVQHGAGVCAAGVCTQCRSSSNCPSGPNWSCDATSGACVFSWQKLSDVPSPRRHGGLVYDPVLRQASLLEGDDQGPLYNDEWVLTLGAGYPLWNRLSGINLSWPDTFNAVFNTADRLITVVGSISDIRTRAPGLVMPTWTDTAANTPLPTRTSYAVAYDTNDHALIVFGGLDGSGAPLGDVWSLTLGGATLDWQPIVPGPGQAPNARSNPSLVYDATDRHLVVFGGVGAGGTPLGDAWSLDLSAVTPVWTQLSSAFAPSARSGQIAAWDSDADRLVVFGGTGAGGALADANAWMLALPSGAWTTTTSTSTSGPSARTDAMAAYDSANKHLLLFGGTADGVNDFGDTWTLDLAGGQGWQLVAGPVEPRQRLAMAYDAAGARLVAFGGDIGPTHMRTNDLLALPLSAPAWGPLAATGTPPAPRDQHSMTYDPAGKRMIVFGGFRPDLGDNGSDTTALSLSGTPAWTVLEPGGEQGLARRGALAVYDSGRGQLALFGGYGQTILGDTWTLSLAASGAKWTSLAVTAPSGLARYGPAGVYDPVGNRLVAFGGSTATSLGYTNDLWSLSLAGTPTWTKVAALGTLPGARENASAVYDALHQRLVVFGGRGFNGADFDDTWELPLAPGAPPQWHKLCVGGTLPLPRNTAGSAALPDGLALFGGIAYYDRETWLLSWDAPPCP